MRKIKQVLITALNNGEDFKSRNVEVKFFGKDLVTIYLWGCQIATYTKFTPKGAEAIVCELQNRIGHSDF